MLRLTAVDTPQEVLGKRAFPMDETTTLTPKQESFCVHYASIGSETFSNGTRSALVAGYSERSAYSQASALLKNPKVKARITELHKAVLEEALLSAGKVLGDIESTRQQALDKGDLAVALRASELQGKHLALFVDRYDIEARTQDQRQYTEDERRECKRLARLMLEDPLRQAAVADQSAEDATALPAPAADARASGEQRFLPADDRQPPQGGPVNQ